MTISRHQRWTLRGGLVAFAALGLYTFVVRDRLIEGWYLWKLDSTDATTRFQAARHLGEMRSVRAVEPLVRLLREADDDPHRQEASDVAGKKTTPSRYLAEILGEIGAPATPALASVLEESRGERKPWRRLAIGLVAETQSSSPTERETVLSSLTDLLEDEWLCVRLAAFRAVGARGPAAERTLPLLTQAMEDSNTHVRTAAENARERVLTSLAVETEISKSANSTSLPE